MSAAHAPRIVVIGGGTGTFTVLSGLKHYSNELTAIVNMVDDGGSSGILRDELGVLPPGDIRQALVALASSEQRLRDLFNYRFPEGAFEGHAFGNLFLSAVEQLSGNFAAAVELAGQVLSIQGQVVPVTTDNVRLGLKTASGRVISGESLIGEGMPGDKLFIKGQPHHLYLDTPGRLYEGARHAIAEADLVIIGPGKLYSSILPSFLIDGLPEALASTPARIVYVSNLMTQPSQTADFCVQDFAAEIERYAGQPILDYVIYNTAHPSNELLARYVAEGEAEVLLDPVASPASYRLIGEDIIATTPAQIMPGDTKIRRTLIRHDSERLARLIMRLYFS